MGRLGLAVLVWTLASHGAAPAPAETVARRVHDGLLALGAGGVPSVAYVKGAKLVVSTRVAEGRWRAVKAAAIPAGAQVMAFAIGARGPVALVRSADARTLTLVRRRGKSWQRIRVAAGLGPGIELGWPGLALDAGGLPAVAYTTWNSFTYDSRLLLARVDSAGRTSAKAITFDGFPQSLVAPPATPVFFGSKLHVVESYGFGTVVATLEWFPDGRTWSGWGLDVGRGEFPLGPVFAKRSSNGTLYAAWTQSVFAFGSTPVTLAKKRGTSHSRFVLDRALATGLVLTPSGPEVAANEWVGAGDLGLAGDGAVWAGTIVAGKARVGIDGWLAGLARGPGGAHQLLLARTRGLQWFRSITRPAIRVNLQAARQPNGSVRVGGRVEGAARGTVTIYRERPGAARRAVGRAQLSRGAFSLTDAAPREPLLYRAVYADPATGIPYAALLAPR